MKTARALEKGVRPGGDVLFLRLRDAVCEPKPSLENIRQCALALNRHTGGDLAVEPELRYWAFAHLTAAAKELPAASATLLAEAVGKLFGGPDIGGDCGGTLVMRLLDPATSLTAPQLTALTNGLARAGVLEGSVTPPVALCGLYMRLTASLTHQQQVQAMVALVKVFGQGNALRMRCEALVQALGQRASSMSPNRIRNVVEGIARGIGGAQGSTGAQTVWLLKRLLAMPGMEGNRLEAAVRGLTCAFGGTDMKQGRFEQFADALAVSMTASDLAAWRVDAVMCAVLKPTGESAPGLERAGWLLARLLTQPSGLLFDTCNRMFRHLFCALLDGKDSAMGNCIARIQGAVRDSVAGPAWFALGVTVAEHPDQRQMLLQGLAKAPLADSKASAASSGTQPSRTDVAVINVVEGLMFQVHKKTQGDTPPAERRAQLDALMDDVLKHLVNAPESHSRPAMHGVGRALHGRNIAKPVLQWAMDRLLQAGESASNRQLARMAEGLARAVGGPFATKENRLVMEAALDAAGAQLSHGQHQLIRFGLGTAWNGTEAAK